MYMTSASRSSSIVPSMLRSGRAPCGSSPSKATSTVTVPCWVFDLVLSTSRGSTAAGAYSWAGGTSMAAPAAAGVAALIKGANPGISLGALKSRLAQTATDSGKTGNDEFYGHGFVNANNACSY